MCHQNTRKIGDTKLYPRVIRYKETSWESFQSRILQISLRLFVCLSFINSISISISISELLILAIFSIDHAFWSSTAWSVLWLLSLSTCSTYKRSLCLDMRPCRPCPDPRPWRWAASQSPTVCWCGSFHTSATRTGMAWSASDSWSTCPRTDPTWSPRPRIHVPGTCGSSSGVHVPELDTRNCIYWPDSTRSILGSCHLGWYPPSWYSLCLYWCLYKHHLEENT